MNKKATLWSFVAIGSIGAFSGWFSFYSFFKGEDFSWPNILISFSIYLLFTLLLSIVSGEHSLYLTLISLSPAIFIAFNLNIILIYIFLIGLFYLGVHRIKKNLDNSIKIEIIRNIIFGYALLTTPLCFILSSTYFFELKKQEDLGILPDFVLEIPVETTNLIITPFEKISPFEVIKPNQTVEKFIEESTKEDMKKNNLPVEEAQFTSEEIREGRNKLSSSLGVEIRQGEKMSSIINKYINLKIKQYFQNIQKEDSSLSAWGFAIGLFLTLKTITWILRFPLSFLVALTIRASIKLNLLSIKKKGVYAERIA